MHPDWNEDEFKKCKDCYSSVTIYGAGEGGSAITLGSSGSKSNKNGKKKEGDPPSLFSVLSKLLKMVFSDDFEKSNSKGKVDKASLKEKRKEATNDFLSEYNQGVNNATSITVNLNTSLTVNNANLDIFNIGVNGTFKLLDDSTYDSHFAFLEPTTTNRLGISYNEELFGVSYSREYSNEEPADIANFRITAFDMEVKNTANHARISFGLGYKQSQTIWGLTIHNEASARLNMYLKKHK